MLIQYEPLWVANGDGHKIKGHLSSMPRERRGEKGVNGEREQYNTIQYIFIELYRIQLLRWVFTIKWQNCCYDNNIKYSLS